LEVTLTYLNSIDIYNDAVESLYLENFHEAKELFLKALDISEDFPDALNNLGIIYHLEGNYRDAITNFNKALKIDNQRKEFWNNRGISSERITEYKGSFIPLEKRYYIAIKCYDEALKIDSQYVKSHINRANCLMGLRKYREAHEVIDSVIKFKPKDPFLWYLKGQCLSEFGKYKEMKQSFMVMNKLDTDFKLPRYTGIAFSPKIFPESDIDYLEGKLDFSSEEIVPVSSIIKSVNVTCLLCTSVLDNLGRCTSCHQSCILCRLALKESDKYDWTTCIHCGDIMHKSHLKSYIKEYGDCPNCRKALSIIDYEVEVDVTQKLAAFVNETLSPNNELTEIQSDPLIPEATYITELLSVMLNQIIMTRKDVRESHGALYDKLQVMELSARERHYIILDELKPISREILLIKSFVTRIDENSLTYDEFYQGMETVKEHFDTIEIHLDVLVQAHKKSKSLLKKIEKATLAGGKEMTGVVLNAGLKDRLKRYLKLPNKEDLSAIFSSIRENISTSKNPIGWLKFAGLLLI
jgi:hypothetical protein